MHGEDSNKLMDQTPLMTAQLSPMDFFLMEPLIAKRDISLYHAEKNEVIRMHDQHHHQHSYIPLNPHF